MRLSGASAVPVFTNQTVSREPGSSMAAVAYIDRYCRLDPDLRLVREATQLQGRVVIRQQKPAQIEHRAYRVACHDEPGNAHRVSLPTGASGPVFGLRVLAAITCSPTVPEIQGSNGRSASSRSHWAKPSSSSPLRRPLRRYGVQSESRRRRTIASTVAGSTWPFSVRSYSRARRRNSTSENPLWLSRCSPWAVSFRTAILSIRCVYCLPSVRERGVLEPPFGAGSAIRSRWRPSIMICSAPSRRAAITPHKPTAPSPITATVFPGPTLAITAAWWPVPSRLKASVATASARRLYQPARRRAFHLPEGYAPLRLVLRPRILNLR
jgi:hypothetical protein